MFLIGKRQNTGGFTLIETAVSILIVGLLITPLFILYNQYVMEKRIEETYSNTSTIIQKLQDFRAINGFYPCPAPIKVATNNPLYGAPHPTACDGATGGTPSLVINTCDTGAGICVEESIRPLDAEMVNPRVIVGMVPFRALQIPEDRAYDAYGARITYAVTESMTDITSINDAAGGIAIMDAEDNQLSDVPGSFGFIAISHGPDKTGAYGKEGTLMEPCTGGAMGQDNCNTGFEDGTAGVSQYRVAFQQEGFDDTVIYFTDNREPLWQRLEEDVENIRDLSPSGVAIGKGTAETTLDIASPIIGGSDSLHVRGDFDPTTNPQGLTGVIIKPEGSELCDEDGTNCMDLRSLYTVGATSTDFRCDTPGTFARGISEGQLDCVTIAVACDDPDMPPPDGAPPDWKPKPIMNGFNPDGSPICVEIPERECVAVNLTMPETCGNTVSLPQSNDGTVIEIDASDGSPFVDTMGRTAKQIMGNCAAVELTCNDSQWEVTAYTGSEGRCGVMFPDTPLPPEYCDPGDPLLECEPGEGSFCVSQRYICDVEDEFAPFEPDPNAFWAISIDYGNPVNTEDCTCPVLPPTDERRSCRVHFNNPQYNTPLSDPWIITTTGHYGTSGPATATTTYGSGTWPTCDGSTGAWNTSQCSCVNPTIDLDNINVQDGNPLTKRYLVACPAGQIVDPDNPLGLPPGTLGRVHQQNWSAPVASCEWGTPSQVNNFCICDTDPIIDYEPHDCGDPICEIPDDNFPDWFMRVPASTPPCALGPVIELTPSTDPAYPLGQCKPRPFHWVKVGTSGDQATVLPGNAITIGDPCSCQDFQDTQGPEDVEICYPGGALDIEFCRCMSSQ